MSLTNKATAVLKDQKINSNSRKELLYKYPSSKPKYFPPNIVKEFQVKSI